VDLVFRNDTATTFQLRVGVGDRHLHGELRAARSPEHSYQVFARDEQFIRYGADHYRRNEIWRRVLDRRTGDPVREELVMRNCALVKYVPSGVTVLLADAPAGS
jgi:vancomycin resistance protein VanW